MRKINLSKNKKIVFVVLLLIVSSISYVLLYRNNNSYNQQALVCESVKEEVISESVRYIIRADPTIPGAELLPASRQLLDDFRTQCPEYAQSRDYHYLTLRYAMLTNDTTAMRKSFEQYLAVDPHEMLLKDKVPIPDDQDIERRITEHEDFKKAQLENLQSRFRPVVVPEGVE